jgi:hypothetical protein
MSIAQVIMDEREGCIRILRRRSGEGNYKLTDKRIGSIITALVDVGDSSPLTNWILAPVINEPRLESAASEETFASSAVLIPFNDYAQRK